MAGVAGLSQLDTDTAKTAMHGNACKSHSCIAISITETIVRAIIHAIFRAVTIFITFTDLSLVARRTASTRTSRLLLRNRIRESGCMARHGPRRPSVRPSGGQNGTCSRAHLARCASDGAVHIGVHWWVIDLRASAHGAETIDAKHEVYPILMLSSTSAVLRQWADLDAVPPRSPVQYRSDTRLTERTE